MRRNFSLFLDIAQKARHTSRPPFGNGIQGNRQVCVFYIRIVKSRQHRFRKLVKLLLRKRQCRDDLVKNRRFNEIQNQFIVHGFQHDIVSAQVRSEYKRGVRSVQNPYFSLLIRFLVIRENNRKSCLWQRQLIADVSGAFDNPERKRFAGYNQVILIAKFFAEFFRLISRISGNNSVHQRRCKYAGVIYPRDKFIFQFPKLRKL